MFLEITRLEEKYTMFKLNNDKVIYTLDHSNIMGCDFIKLYCLSLCNLTKENPVQYIAFHGESIFHILRMTYNDDTKLVDLDLFYQKESSFSLPCSGDSLEPYLKSSTLCFKYQHFLYNIAWEFYELLTEYRSSTNKDSFTTSNFEFPHEEYKILKSLLGD